MTAIICTIFALIFADYFLQFSDCIHLVQGLTESVSCCELNWLSVKSFKCGGEEGASLSNGLKNIFHMKFITVNIKVQWFLQNGRKFSSQFWLLGPFVYFLIYVSFSPEKQSIYNKQKLGCKSVCQSRIRRGVEKTDI